MKKVKMPGRLNRPGRGRPARTALATAFAVIAAGAFAVSPTTATAATTTTLFVSPTGSGTSCTSAAPCSVTQARTSVEAIDGDMSGNIVVQLAAGTANGSLVQLWACNGQGNQQWNLG
ncbi:MAG: hypothetical protein JF587_23210 [Catenulisporales bacterium]|nr:hypothetical protein [Catenulisporales bacterium]